MKTYLRLAALLLLANVCALCQVGNGNQLATLGNVGVLADQTYSAGSQVSLAIPISLGSYGGMNYFKVEFSPLSGSNITSCSVYVDSSINGQSWTQGGAVSGQTCTSQGSATNGPVSANYVRLDIYVAGVGTVRVRLLGAMSSLAGGGGGGGVSSVGLSLPAGLFSVTGSPVTGSGTLSATFTTISAHLYLGNNTSSPQTAGLVQPAFSDLTGQATTTQLPFTYTTSNSSTLLVTAGSTFTGSAGSGVCLDGNLNLTTSGCSGSMVWPSSAGIAVYSGSSSWGTSLTAPSSTIVGISDTQTLTNKSIAASEINSGTLAAARLPAALSSSTSINGLAITASTGTLTISGSKTLTISNSLTLAGTDGTTQTFPSTSGTVLTSVSAAGGDLTGTYPNPTVLQINGGAVPVSKTIVGTNSSGQLIDASSATLSNNTSGTAAGLSTGATIAGLSNGCLQISSNVITSTGSSCSAGGGMVYPSGTGIAVVTGGAAWGTTLTAPTGSLVGTGQANTYSTGLQSFASATLALPSASSYAPTTAGLFGYDSTNNRAVLGNGTNTSYLTWITAAPTNGDVAEFSGTLGALSDTSIAAANVVTQTSNGAANYIATYSTTNKVLVPAATLPTAAMPALTGDVSNSAGSLSVTVSKINGTSVSGTQNDVVAFGASNTLADTSILYTNLTTQTSNGAANEVCTYTGTNKVCVPGTVANAMLTNSTIGIAGTSNQITSSTSSPALGGSTTLAIANPFTFPGKATLAASTTSASSLNVPTGSAPSSPVSGDFWNTSGILKFYDGSHTNSLTTIQTSVTSGDCPQFSGTAGLLIDSGSICPSITGLASGQVVVASSATAITSYSGFTSDSSGDVTVNSLNVSSSNPGIAYIGQGTTPWGVGTTSVGLTAPTSVTSYNLVFPSAASAGTNASSGVYYLKFGTGQNQTGCTASSTELCGYLEANVDLTKDVGSTILPGGNGGTGSAFVAFTGPSSLATFTLPNASATILTNNAAVTVAQGGTGVNTLMAHAILLGEGTSNMSSVGPCASNVPLIGQGSSADPICSTITYPTSLTSGGVLYASSTTAIASSALLAANAIVVGGGAGTAPSTDANATLSAGALSLGASGTSGSVIFGNASSGTITLQTVTGALGTVTLSLPATTGTIFESGGTNTANSGAIFDFSTITTGALKVPSNANNTTGGNAQIAFDTTNKDYHLYVNSTDSKIAVYASSLTPTATQCATWVAAGNAWTLGSASCGSGGSSAWSGLGNATAALTLSNAGYATTFDQTSAVDWLWANTTTATSGTTNGSPVLQLAANYWTGSASAQDTWSVSSSLAAGTNGASTLTFAHSGSSGVLNTVFPGSVSAASFSSSGSNAGALTLGQGTANSTSTTSITLQAPTSVTPYIMTLPGSIGVANQALGITSVSGSTATLGFVGATRTLSVSFGTPGGTAISTGVLGYVRWPYACTGLASYSITADAGTATVKTWKVATGTAIPTTSNSISTSGVSLSTGTNITSTTVTDFTTQTTAANDLFGIDLSTVSGVGFINFELVYTGCTQ